MGMEHTLQVYLTLLVLLGLLKVWEGEKPSRTLLLAIALGPLVRYESILISGMAIVILYAFHFRRIAFWLALFIVLTISSFSLALLYMGQDFLPNSIMVKKVGAGPGYLALLDVTINKMLKSPLGVAYLILLTASSFLSFHITPNKQREKFTSALIALSLLAYPLIGRFTGNTSPRYENFMIAFCFLLLLYLWKDNIFHSLNKPLRKLLYATAIPFLGIGIYYSTIGIVNDGRAIYLQHYQIHRFLTEYWKAPVAVNDIGLISYNNHYRIYDLIGLSNRHAYISRKNSNDSLWADRLVREENIKLIIIFPEWFSGGERQNWFNLGILSRPEGMSNKSPEIVAFETTDRAMVGPLREMLSTWAKQLPPPAKYIESTD
jgi:hypothetical protein